MDFIEFSDFESFKRFYTKEHTCAGVQMLMDAGRTIESLQTHALIQLTHYLWGQWPHMRDKNVLIGANKRAIQYKFYKDLYNCEPSARIIEGYEKARTMLDLQDEPAIVSDIPRKVRIKPKNIETKPTKPKKEPKPLDDISIRIKNSSVDELIKWCEELNISKDLYERYMNKPIGMKKMNIGNLIRATFKKKSD